MAMQTAWDIPAVLGVSLLEEHLYTRIPISPVNIISNIDIITINWFEIIQNILFYFKEKMLA